MTFDEWWERRGMEAVHMYWSEDVARFAWTAALESASQTCEKVCKASRQHLFRSGAKICAGEIRNMKSDAINRGKE